VGIKQHLFLVWCPLWSRANSSQKAVFKLKAWTLEAASPEGVYTLQLPLLPMMCMDLFDVDK